MWFNFNDGDKGPPPLFAIILLIIAILTICITFYFINDDSNLPEDGELINRIILDAEGRINPFKTPASDE